MRLQKTLILATIAVLTACSKSYGKKMTPEEAENKIQEIENAPDPGYTKARVDYTATSEASNGQREKISGYQLYEYTGTQHEGYDVWENTGEGTLPEEINVIGAYLSCTIDHIDAACSYVFLYKMDYMEKTYYSSEKGFTVVANCANDTTGDPDPLFKGKGDITWDLSGYLTEVHAKINVEMKMYNIKGTITIDCKIIYS